MNDREYADAIAARASLLIDQRNFEQAMEMLKQALAQKPDHGFALYLLAYCQIQSDKDLDAALESIRLAIAAEPHAPRFHAMKAAIHSGRSEYAKALSSAEDAVALDPLQSAGHVEKGRALIGMHRWREAEESLRQALAVDPDDSAADNLLIVALQFQNRTNETESRIREALGRDPQDAYAHANAGWSALRGGDLQKAEFHFREALRLDPGNEHSRLGVLETFKAKSPLYRAYLSYCFAMGRLQPKHQLMIIVGLYVFYRLSRSILTGPLKWAGTLLAVVYMLFALWSWVARGVGNLLLMLNGFARLALRKEEKIEAALVGGNVLAGLPLYLAGLAATKGVLMLTGMLLVASAFPFSVTFSNNHKTGRRIYGIAGTVVWAAAVLFFTLNAFNLPEAAKMLFGIGSITALASIWLGAFGVMRR